MNLYGAANNCLNHDRGTNRLCHVTAGEDTDKDGETKL